MTYDKTTVSLVCPVYQGVANLNTLYAQLCDVLPTISPSYEIIFVEDGSTDNSWELLEAIASRDLKVRAIKLSRNYGQQAAISAGLSLARGQWAVVMDCDLQDPVLEIPRLFAKAQEGHDVVLARRQTREYAPVRKILSRMYFALLSALTGTAIDGRCGSFSLISRTVVDAYLNFSDCNRHYMLILLWLGFDRGYIDYEHGKSLGNGSTYNLGTLIRLAIQGILFQSNVFLEWVLGAGIVASLFGFLLAAFALIQYLICKNVLPGWTSSIIITLLMGGLNLLALGIVGFYVGHTFEQTKKRPLFIVQKSLNNPEENMAEVAVTASAD